MTPQPSRLSENLRPSFHRPQFYRYEVSGNAPRRPMLNRYGWQIIGVAVRVGRFAYCVKWAGAR